MHINISKSILYPKASKEFYHHIKFRKNIMNRRCSIKKPFLKISQYSQENTCVGVSLLLKIQAFRPATLLKRDSKKSVFFPVKLEKFLRTLTLKNICERLLLHRKYFSMIFTRSTLIFRTP